MSPPLKWAGGKRWLTPRLRELYQPYRDRRLAEPFVGGLAVSLGLLPERALLRDINPHAISFYRWLQSGLVISREMVNNRAHYDQARERFNELIQCGAGESQEAAELFYYLNRTCFNGLCRFNRGGSFNVPFGRYKAIRYTTDFSAYVPVLERWEIRYGDFASMPLEPGDFIYADPPYDVEFRQYSSGGFTWEDQVRLADWLSQHSGPVIASNQASRRIIELYQSRGFTLTTLSAPRRISCNGDRTRAVEMLAMRNVQHALD